MRLNTLLFVVFAAACGSQGTGTPPPAPREPALGGTEPSTPAIDAINEWGLVSVRQNTFELAAGPGRQHPLLEEITIDKPVLYVHANERTRLHVGVSPGTGLRVAEHFPPSSSASLTWDVEVTPGECTAPRDYTGSCNSTDGYCETRELSLYETRDASCLSQAGLALPLLFYRLHADEPQELPLRTVRGEGGDVTISNAGLAAGAPVWRVTWDGERTHARRIDAPALGADATIPTPLSGGVESARGHVRQGLLDHGLSSEEASAFMRAWDSTLFGRAGSVDEDGDDGLRADETPRSPQTGSPRIRDAILYWLPESDIERMATLTFRPAPREIHRAILVRASLQ